MPQISTERNPFLLMLNPEVVVAAMQASERLSGLNRHLCRPLDRPTNGTRKQSVVEVEEIESDDDAGETQDLDDTV